MRNIVFSKNNVLIVLSLGQQSAGPKSHHWLQGKERETRRNGVVEGGGEKGKGTQQSAIQSVCELWTKKCGVYSESMRVYCGEWLWGTMVLRNGHSFGSCDDFVWYLMSSYSYVMWPTRMHLQHCEHSLEEYYMCVW